MKISIALSLVILAIGGLFGWRGNQRIHLARTTQQDLITEAQRVGLPLDITLLYQVGRGTKNPRTPNRGDNNVIARGAAVDFIAFARQMEAAKRDAGPFDRKTLLANLDLMDRLMSLDASQMKVLIDRFRAVPDLQDETRRNFIGFFAMTLANENPQEALALVTGSAGPLVAPNTDSYIVHLSLAKWSKDDPSAALEWFRTEGAKYPNLMTDMAKRGLIAGTATDPKIAFSLISELKIGWRSAAISDITGAVRSPAQRGATLVALREYLAALPPGTERQDKKDAISNLVHAAAKDGFDAATRWIEKAGITPDELGVLHGSTISDVARSEETGRWIDWMGKTIPSDKLEEPVRSMVSKWTDGDYLAAGTWLANSGDSPTKEICVRAYAETVARYEPETAVQWAMTLPGGKPREQTLRTIYQNWPKNDVASKAAAEAFAESHDIHRWEHSH